VGYTVGMIDKYYSDMWDEWNGNPTAVTPVVVPATPERRPNGIVKDERERERQQYLEYHGKERRRYRLRSASSMAPNRRYRRVGLVSLVNLYDGLGLTFRTPAG